MAITRIDPWVGGLGIDATGKFEVASNATVTVGNGTSTGNVNVGGEVVSSTVDATTLKLGGTAVTSTAAELNYTDGVTSNIQTQLDAKAPTAGPTFTGTLTYATLNDGTTALTSTVAELNYTDGVTSNIQTQLDGKQASGSYLTGNQTITLSGDVSGSGTTAITVTVADDSHNHTISNVDGLQAALDGKQASGSYLTGNQTITLSGDASGSGTTAITVTVADDSHNHIISNVDGLQTALDAKLASSSYTAADILTKIKTVDGAGSGLDADLLDGISSASFLRSDTADSFSGAITGTGSISISGNINTTAKIQEDGADLIPPGSIIMYGAAAAPGGWYLCEGGAISRSTYAALFSAIGTTYGVGNGSTTFNVPDFRDRAPYGASTFTLGSKTAGEVNASGQNSTGTGTTGSTGGSTVANTTGSGGPTTHTVTTAATNSTTDKDVSAAINAVTGVSAHAAHSHTVTYPAVAVKFIIKT